MYRLIMSCRNWCFEHGLLQQQVAPYPVISVGNLSVGGTGKTPMTEWLIRQLLAQHFSPIVISRGYGRKTRGPLLAHSHSTADMIGDEPLQIYRKFAGSVPVIVSEDRRKALPLIAMTPELRQKERIVLLLDDAYQHRYLQRDCNILLTPYRRPYTRDHVLPWGRLRESRKGAHRADIIVVTKCPRNLSPQQAETLQRKLAPLAHQQVFFSTIGYEDIPEEIRHESAVTLLTGIADPSPLVEHLQQNGVTIDRHLRYADHHRFTPAERQQIEESPTPVITTEKDYARLKPQAHIHPIGIHPVILFNQQDILTNTIIRYVNHN